MPSRLSPLAYHSFVGTALFPSILVNHSIQAMKIPWAHFFLIHFVSLLKAAVSEYLARLKASSASVEVKDSKLREVVPLSSLPKCSQLSSKYYYLWVWSWANNFNFAKIIMIIKIRVFIQVGRGMPSVASCCRNSRGREIAIVGRFALSWAEACGETPNLFYFIMLLNYFFFSLM